jgi:hypothetical protein
MKSLPHNCGNINFGKIKMAYIYRGAEKMSTKFNRGYLWKKPQS